MRTASCCMTLQVLEIVPADCLVLVLCVSSFAHDEKNSTHLHSDVSRSIDHTQLPDLSAKSMPHALKAFCLYRVCL